MPVIKLKLTFVGRDGCYLMSIPWPRRGRFPILIFFIFVSLFAVEIFLAGSKVTEKSPNFLPSSWAHVLPRQIAGWEAKGEDQFFDRNNLFDYMNGAGEIYLAFDFQWLFVREYTRGGSPSVIVEIYQMGSSEDAYGLFTQDTDGEDVVCGQDAIYAAGLLRFWKDRIFVRILAEKELPATRSIVIKLGEMIAAAISQEGKRPALVEFLPASGIRPRTIRFFHTVVSLNVHYYLSSVNVLNLSPATDAVLADYSVDGPKAKLLFVSYPSSAEASQAAGQFVIRYLEGRVLGEGELLIKEIDKGKWAGVQQRDKYLIIVLEADGLSLCQRLADEANDKIMKGKDQ